MRVVATFNGAALDDETVADMDRWFAGFQFSDTVVMEYLEVLGEDRPNGVLRATACRVFTTLRGSWPIRRGESEQQIPILTWSCVCGATDGSLVLRARRVDPPPSSLVPYLAVEQPVIEVVGRTADDGELSAFIALHEGRT